MPSLLRNVLRKNSEESGFQAPKALTSKRGMKEYAESIMSTGGSTIRSVRSIAESITSFYSLMSGGSRVPKRRRPDVSRLGVPKFYHKNPKPALEIPGVNYLDTNSLGPYTAAHAQSFPRNIQGVKPWASIVLYSHATTDDPFPIYHARAKIQGELRIRLDEPMPIVSIDVWLVGKAECIIDLAQQPFLNATANLWSRSSGNPLLPHDAKMRIAPFKGKFPAGTYVFPFDFPALPRDVEVFQMDVKMNAPKHCRIVLPCSHEVSETVGWVGWQKYLIGINIRKDGITELNEEWNMPFHYFPRGRPIPRPEAPFPFLSTREDWPFSREEVGGWILTPFGGRGRFRDEIIELEGILGIQAPGVYSPGQTIRYGLLLWCTNAEALSALSSPTSIQVDYVRSDMFGLNVLDPHNSARKNRRLTPMGDRGRIWRTDDGPFHPLTPNITYQESTVQDKISTQRKKSWQTAQMSVSRSNYVPRRMRELYSESADESSPEALHAVIPTIVDKSEAASIRDIWTGTGSVETHKPNDHDSFLSSTPLLHDNTSITMTDDTIYEVKLSSVSLPIGAVGSDVKDDIIPGLSHFKASDTTNDDPPVSGEDTRAASPTPSLEDLGDVVDDVDESKQIVRLDGELTVPLSMPPNYRWRYQGLEYLLHVLITHPDYSHISPSATGIQAETPLWIVTDPPRMTDSGEPPFGPVNPATIRKKGEAIPLPPNTIRKPPVTGDGTDEIRPSWLGVRTWAFF